MEDNKNIDNNNVITRLTFKIPLYRSCTVSGKLSLGCSRVGLRLQAHVSTSAPSVIHLSYGRDVG